MIGFNWKFLKKFHFISFCRVSNFKKNGKKYKNFYLKLYALLIIKTIHLDFHTSFLNNNKLVILITIKIRNGGSVLWEGQKVHKNQDIS